MSDLRNQLIKDANLAKKKKLAEDEFVEPPYFVNGAMAEGIGSPNNDQPGSMSRVAPDEIYNHRITDTDKDFQQSDDVRERPFIHDQDGPAKVSEEARSRRRDPRYLGPPLREEDKGHVSADGGMSDEDGYGRLTDHGGVPVPNDEHDREDRRARRREMRKERAAARMERQKMRKSRRAERMAARRERRRRHTAAGSDESDVSELHSEKVTAAVAGTSDITNINVRGRLHNTTIPLRMFK